MSDNNKILKEILDMPPVDTNYIFNRWHKDRFNLKGITTELKVFLKHATVPPNLNNTRFLIVGRARSGTTLLTKLLNSHSQVTCDGEIFHRTVINMYHHFRRLAEKTDRQVYGAKLLSYQMVQVQKMVNADRFLERLHSSNVKIIHIERNTFFQTLSLLVAQKSNGYHSDKGAAFSGDKLYVDPVNFLERVRWNEALLNYERILLANIPHFKISYEDDLCDPDNQRSTFANLCEFLGIKVEKVPIPLKKVLPENPQQIVKNFSEVYTCLKSEGYSKLLEK